MHHIALFANPIAGRGKARDLVHTITNALHKQGYTVHPILQQAARLTPDQLTTVRSAHAIVVIGGDGTLRQVVDKVLHASPHQPPFLMVPMGTANLMAQYLALRTDPDNIGSVVAQTITRHKTIEIDAASVTSAPGESASLPASSPSSSITNHQSSVTSLMLLVAGVGIDAQIVHQLSRLRRGPITKLSYALPAALALSQYRFPKLHVTVDNKSIFSGQGITLVGNVKEYGTGFPILPHARPDDGLLDICTLPCTHPGELFKLFLQAASGQHLEQEGVTYTKGTHVSIHSTDPAPLQIDGEPAGFTPVQIDLLDTRVKFLVP